MRHVPGARHSVALIPPLARKNMSATEWRAPGHDLSVAV